jgi:outer membrane receptor protein involved in Fe transport
MSKLSLRRAIAACTLPAAMLSAPALVLAEEAIEEVVVTGSFIRGTPQDTALPVDVLSAQDLRDVGNPTITEMIRNLNISNGNIGETNQFNASGGQSNEGVATINLRGLGSARTLVLVNGRRHVSTANIGVDISAIPSIAIGRIEVLKDGAAALYGSDAIAGVTNFITRDNFEGAEFRLSGQTFEETDGEYQAGIMLGTGNDRWHVTGAFEYERRSEVRLGDLDWAVRPQSTNPQGGYSSIGNPGTIFPVGVTDPDTGALGIIGRVPDPGCEAFGNTLASNTCFFQFTNYDNLVEQQDTYKAFTEANYAVTENIDFHIEALYSRMEIPKWATSPSYPPQSLFGPDRLVPATHPGVQDLIANNPGLLPAGTVAVYPLTRHAGAGGYVNGEPRRGERETDTYRLATGLDGTLFDGQLGFDVAVSWSKRDRTNVSPDMYVERLALALDGLGGPDCDPVNGTPGQGGCLYHTPFSNGVEQSFVNGYVNPDANADLVRMNRELQPWLETDLSSETSYELLVFDATFDGELPIELAGGTVGWAAGIQTRNEQFSLSPAAINDLTVNPCPFVDPVSVTLGNTDTLDCTQSALTTDTGLFAFLSGTFPADTERTVYGAFAELGLPISERLNAQLAVRFEDYGGNVGSTVDPKLALRFQATDAITLRGSVSTTFRGPPQNFLEGRTTSLQFTAPANAFKAVDTSGNPDLEPETALATNFGVVLDTGNFFGSLDYWRFDFENPLQVENFNAVVSAYSANSCAPGAAGDGSATCDSLQQQVIFQPGSEGTLSAIQRIRINYINGGDITTSGFDWFGQYDFETDFGLLEVGTQGTYTAEYDVGDFENFNGVFLLAGGDFAGNLNDNRNTITPITDLQGSVFARFSRDAHRLTVTGRYWGEYDDEGAIADLQTIDEHFTVDVNYNVSLMEDKLGVNVSVFNLFDNLAPRAQTDLNYDPYTHSPFGRMIKVGLTYNL